MDGWLDPKVQSTIPPWPRVGRSNPLRQAAALAAATFSLAFNGAEGESWCIGGGMPAGAVTVPVICGAAAGAAPAVADAVADAAATWIGGTRT